MRFCKINLLVLFICLSCGSAVGDSLYITVYKWTDGEGNMHYSENPSPDYPSTPVEVLADSFNKSAPARMAPKPKPVKSDNKTDEEKKWNEQAKKACEHAKENYKILDSGTSNVMMKGSDGVPRPMSPQEQSEEKEKAKLSMDYYCKMVK